MQSESGYKVQILGVGMLRAGFHGDPDAAVASFALDGIPQCKTWDDAPRQFGHGVLEAMGQSSNPEVATLATVMNEASSVSLYQDDASKAQAEAFKLMRDGSTGTLIQKIAHMGDKALLACSKGDDQRHLGRASSTPSAVVDPARRARRPDAALPIQDCSITAPRPDVDTLERIAGGSNESLDKQMARLGLDAHKRGQSGSTDGSTMAQSLLEDLRGTATDPALQRILKAAAEAAAKSSTDAVHLQADAFNAVLAWQPAQTAPAVQLAEYGKKTALSCTSAEGQRWMGQAILDAIQAQGTGVARDVAAAAREATNPHLYHFSAAGRRQNPLELIASGSTDPAAKQVARLGLLAQNRGQANTNDEATMAQVLLEKLPSLTPARAAGDLEDGCGQRSRRLTTGDPAAGLQVGAAGPPGDDRRQQRPDLREGAHQGEPRGKGSLDATLALANTQMQQLDQAIPELRKQFDGLTATVAKQSKIANLARAALPLGGFAILGGIATISGMHAVGLIALPVPRPWEPASWSQNTWCQNCAPLQNPCRPPKGKCWGICSRSSKPALRSRPANPC